jgi:FixJ family two-component response regulator
VTTVILIVDDDVAVRDSLQLFLEIRGCEVETFESGTQLFFYDGRARCDCLLLDIDLPGEGGFEVLTKLRNQGFGAPAIFMSGQANGAARLPSHLTRVVACFDKPVPPLMLMAAIAEATGHTH